MTFLKIFLILTAINTILTMSSVRLRFSYCQELGLKISYLFFSYTVFPKKQKAKEKAAKAKKKKRADKEAKKKENLLQTVYHEKGLGGLLHLLQTLAQAAGGALQTLFRHIRAKKLSLHLAVAAEDAAQTAVLYGKVCAVVYPAVSVLASSMKCRHYEVAVVPNFQTEETAVQGEADVKVRVVYLLTAALKALLQYMKAAKAATLAKDDQTKKTEKGGAKNEQSSD